MTKKFQKKGGSNYELSNNALIGQKRSVLSKFTDFGKKRFKVIILVIILIGLCVGGYFIYQNYNSNKVNLYQTVTLIPNIYDATLEQVIPYSKLPQATSSNEYNINMWIYINNYTYRQNEDKCILFKGLIKGKLRGIHDRDVIQSNPSIWLLKKKNKLRVFTGLDTSFRGNKEDFCDVDYFPVQKWVNLNIGLRNNVLDIHINGKLHKSCILSGTPVTNTGDIYICKEGKRLMGGFNGYLSKVEYTNIALNSSKISSIYKSGPTLKENKSFFSKLFN